MIRKRGNNSWEIRIDCGRDPVTGKRLQGYHSFKGTKAAAKAEERRLLHERDVGLYAIPSRQTLEDYLKQWMDFKKARVRARTVEGYQSIINKHILPAVGQLRLQNVKTVQLDQYYSQMYTASGGKLSAQSVTHHHRLLHAAFEQAVTWKYLTQNPAHFASPPKVETQEVEPIPSAELKRFVQIVRNTDLFIPVMLGAATGARRGEVLALKWSDLTPETGIIWIRASLQSIHGEIRFEKPKTKRSERSITLPTFVLMALQQHREAQDQMKALMRGAYRDEGLICSRRDGSPWVPGRFSAAVHELTTKAGMSGVHFHRLRHTHGSELIAHGNDIQATSTRLGHSTTTTTLRIYTHTIEGVDQKAAITTQAIFGPAFEDAAIGEAA